MREEFIKKNPMNAVPTIKKSNYLAKQNKEVLPVCETITVFTDEEIEKFKAEAYKKYPSGKRIVPLNETAIQAIIELRNERYFGEDAPLIPDADGNFTRPLNLRKRFYSILDAAVIEKKGLHSLRHTFATKLVTGVRAEDGTVNALTPRQVTDLLGHTTSEITEMYYVKRNTDMLLGVTNGFEL